MSKPWDVPKLPRRGDADQVQTYAHMGFTIARWEAVEFDLSRLHSFFLGSLDELAPMRDYGEPRIFRERADKLAKAANAYFTAHPNQSQEAHFDAILASARGYSNRRNEIAHGMVFRIDVISYFRRNIKPQLLKRPHFAVIPPLYALRAHRSGFPDWAYNSQMMERLCHRLIMLQKKIREAFGQTLGYTMPPPPELPESFDAT